MTIAVSLPMPALNSKLEWLTAMNPATSTSESVSGHQPLGRITKMGQRDLRRLLFLGAMAVIRHVRRRKEIADPWRRRMLTEKPVKLVALPLANKMARTIWGLMVKKESYRPPRVMSVVAG